jgi:hypothetical protein
MRLACATAVATALAVAMAAPGVRAGSQDANRPVAGGGISVPGWQGVADRGRPVNEAKLTKEGNTFQVTTGPAITFWNPANQASGDYTVKATFNEPKYMNLNDHPHPYGIVIAGNDMGTEQQSYLYCSAYGDGTFIVRGFGPAPFQVGGRSPEANAAVHKASGSGQPVSQEIAMSVKGDKVTCAINGTVVGSYDKSTLVTAGKLKSTDGVYGFRFAHNTDGTVTDDPAWSTSAEEPPAPRATSGAAAWRYGAFALPPPSVISSGRFPSSTAPPARDSAAAASSARVR